MGDISDTLYTIAFECNEARILTSTELKNYSKFSVSDCSRDGITGCAIYYFGKFIQIFEGDEAKVLELYSKIKSDHRLEEVYLFSEDSIIQKDFPNWGMAYYPENRNVIEKNEFVQFRNNLRLMAAFSKPTNLTSKLFWKRVEMYLEHIPNFLKLQNL